MNPISKATTSAFLEYRKRAASAPLPAPVTLPPVRKPVYPHVGWLSAQETTDQRMERLIGAIAAGCVLKNSEWAWFDNQRSCRGGGPKQWTRNLRKRDASMQAYLAKYTQPVIGGM